MHTFYIADMLRAARPPGQEQLRRGRLQLWRGLCGGHDVLAPQGGSGGLGERERVFAEVDAEQAEVGRAGRRAEQRQQQQQQQRRGGDEVRRGEWQGGRGGGCRRGRE